MNQPSFSLQANRLVERTQRTAEPLWQRAVVSRSILANKLYIVYRDHEIGKLAEALFAVLGSKTREREQLLVVLRLPLLSDPPNRTWPHTWNFKAFLAEEKIPFIDLGDRMPRKESFYIPNDEHFSAKGTAYVAHLLSRMDIFGKD